MPLCYDFLGAWMMQIFKLHKYSAWKALPGRLLENIYIKHSTKPPGMFKSKCGGSWNLDSVSSQIHYLTMSLSCCSCWLSTDCCSSLNARFPYSQLLMTILILCAKLDEIPGRQTNQVLITRQNWSLVKIIKLKSPNTKADLYKRELDYLEWKTEWWWDPVY